MASLGSTPGVLWDARLLPELPSRTGERCVCCGPGFFVQEAAAAAHDEAGRRYFIEECRRTAQVRVYSWVNAPQSWAEFHENAADPQGVPVSFCERCVQIAMDNGMMLGRFPPVRMVAAGVADQPVAGVPVAGPPVSATMPVQKSAESLAGSFEGVDGNGVRYGERPISREELPELAAAVSGREFVVWITGHRLGSTFGIGALDSEYLFRIRCTGLGREPAYSGEKGGRPRAGVQFYVPFLDRAFEMAQEEAVMHVSRGGIAGGRDTGSGIRPSGRLHVGEHEGKDSDGRRFDVFPGIEDVVKESATAAGLQAAEGAGADEEFRKRQAEFLAMLDRDEDGRLENPANRGLTGSRSGIGHLDSPGGLRDVNRKLAGLRGESEKPPSYSQVPYSPRDGSSPRDQDLTAEHRPRDGRQTDLERQQRAKTVIAADTLARQPVQVGRATPGNEVSFLHSMPTSPLLMTVEQFKEQQTVEMPTGLCAYANCSDPAGRYQMYCTVHSKFVCSISGCNKLAAEQSMMCGVHQQYWLDNGAVRCVQTGCNGILLPSMTGCPVCITPRARVTGVLTKCESCHQFYPHDPSRPGECTRCGFGAPKVSHTYQRFGKSDGEGRRGDSRSPRLDGEDRSGGENTDGDRMLQVLERLVDLQESGSKAMADAMVRTSLNITAEMRQTREEKEKATDVYPALNASAVNLLRAAAEHGGPDAIGAELTGLKLARVIMETANESQFPFDDRMTPLKARALANLDLGLGRDDNGKLMDLGGVGYGDFRSVPVYLRETEVLQAKLGTARDTRRQGPYVPCQTLKELEECGENMFRRFRHVYGRLYERLFKLSLVQKRELHSMNPVLYTEVRLCEYADEELAVWAYRRVRRCAQGYESCLLSEEELFLAQEYSFAPVPLILTTPTNPVFVKNFNRRYYFARERALDRVMQLTQVPRNRGAVKVPTAGIMVDSLAETQEWTQVYGAATYDEAMERHDFLGASEQDVSVCEDAVQPEGGMLTAEDLGVEWDFDAEDADEWLDAAPEGGASNSMVLRSSGSGYDQSSSGKGGKGAASRVMQSAGQQVQFRDSRRDQSRMQKPSRAGAFKPGENIPRHTGGDSSLQRFRPKLKQIFIAQVPKYKGQPICWALLCHGGCKLDPKHPLYKTGSVCPNYHPTSEQEKVALLGASFEPSPGFLALCVEHGGYKDPRYPSKAIPMDLQVRQAAVDYYSADAEFAMHKKGVPPQFTQRDGAGMPADGIDTDAAREVAIDLRPVSGVTVQHRTVTAALQNVGSLRITVGDVHRDLEVLDTGSVISWENGSRDYMCILKGAALLFGVQPAELYHSVVEWIQHLSAAAVPTLHALLYRLQEKLVGPPTHVPLDVLRLMGDLLADGPMVCYHSTISVFEVFVFRSPTHTNPEFCTEAVLIDKHFMPLRAGGRLKSSWAQVAAWLAALRAHGVVVREAVALPGLFGAWTDGKSATARVEKTIAEVVREAGLLEDSLSDILAFDAEDGIVAESDRSKLLQNRTAWLQTELQTHGEEMWQDLNTEEKDKRWSVERESRNQEIEESARWICLFHKCVKEKSQEEEHSKEWTDNSASCFGLEVKQMMEIEELLRQQPEEVGNWLQKLQELRDAEREASRAEPEITGGAGDGEEFYDVTELAHLLSVSEEELWKEAVACTEWAERLFGSEWPGWQQIGEADERAAEKQLKEAEMEQHFEDEQVSAGQIFHIEFDGESSQVRVGLGPEVEAGGLLEGDIEQNNLYKVDMETAELQRLQVHARRITNLLNQHREGLEENKEAQTEIIRAYDDWAAAAAQGGHEADWPMRLWASKLSLHPGTIDPEVHPLKLAAFATGDVPDHILETAVMQQTHGVLMHMHRPRVRQRAPVLPSARMCLREVWANIWKDVGKFRTCLFGPRSLELMNSARIQCSPIARVPKKSPRTGEILQNKGRVINNGAWTGMVAKFSVNSNIALEAYGDFTLPRHSDFGALTMFLRFWLGWRVKLVMCKLDADAAFRRKWLAAIAYGEIAEELAGYTALEASGVFGPTNTPVVYNVSKEVIDRKHNNSDWVFRGADLLAELMEISDSRWPEISGDLAIMNTAEMSQNLEEQGCIVREGARIPFTSNTYVDDGMLVAPDIADVKEKSAEVYKEAMRVALGDGSISGQSAVSTKDPEEMMWKEMQTVLGHPAFVDRGYYMTSDAKWELLRRLIHEPCWDRGCRKLHAEQVYSTWGVAVWVALVNKLVTGIAIELKRPLEGEDFSRLEPKQLVSPDRKGEDPESRWDQLWSAVETLRVLTTSYAADDLRMRMPFWRMLPHEQQIHLPGVLEDATLCASDACIAGQGGVRFNPPYMDWWRRPNPVFVQQEIEISMDKGHEGLELDLHTVAIVEIDAAVTTEREFTDEESRLLWLMIDNMNAVIQLQKRQAEALRAQYAIRISDQLSIENDSWSIYTYINTHLNKGPDLLSRSFRRYRDGGGTDHEVMREFFEYCKSLNLQPRQFFISEEWMEFLIPRVLAGSVTQQLKYVQGYFADTKLVDAVANREAGATLKYTCTVGCHGLGGSVLGFEQTGRVAVTHAYDTDPYAQAEMKKTHPETVQLGDARGAAVIEAPTTDMYGAGAPCTAAAMCGLQMGLEDPVMFIYITLAIRFCLKGYKCGMFEMVPNILKLLDGLIQYIFECIFEEYGYEYTVMLIHAWHCGVPQFRTRLHTYVTNPIYGSHRMFEPPVPTPPAGSPKCGNDIMEADDSVSDRLYFDPKSVRVLLPRPQHIPGRPHIVAHRGKGGLGHGGNPGTVYSIEAEGEFIPTLLQENCRCYERKTPSGVLYRGLSVRECARAQGFPDNYPLPDDEVVARSLLGRAEPPPMAKVGAEALVKFLDDTRPMWEGKPAGLVPHPSDARLGGKFLADDICPSSLHPTLAVDEVLVTCGEQALVRWKPSKETDFQGDCVSWQPKWRVNIWTSPIKLERPAEIASPETVTVETPSEDLSPRDQMIEDSEPMTPSESVFRCEDYDLKAYTYAQVESETAGAWSPAYIYPQKENPDKVVIWFSETDRYEGLGNPFSMTDNILTDADGEAVQWREAEEPEHWRKFEVHKHGEVPATQSQSKRKSGAQRKSEKKAERIRIQEEEDRRLTQNEQTRQQRLDAFRKSEEFAEAGVQRKPNVRKGARRDRYVVQLQSRLMKNTQLQLDAASLSAKTMPRYQNSWQQYVEFCEDHELEPVLTGANPQEDIQTLKNYVTFEYVLHGNSYGTIRNKLYAIRWHVMELGYSSPLDHPKIKKILKGLKRLRGARTPKQPATPQMLRKLKAGLKGLIKSGNLWAVATTAAVEFAFFFLCRISEIAAEDSKNVAKYIIRRKHVAFYRSGEQCDWWENPDEVAVWIPGSKTDQDMQGTWRSHFLSGSDLCVVSALVQWFELTHDLVHTDEPLFAVPKDSGGVAVLTRAAVADALKSAAVECGIPASDISTHSCRIGGATVLLHCGASPHAVAVAGRWASDCFMRYTRWTRQLMRGVAADMAHTAI